MLGAPPMGPFPQGKGTITLHIHSLFAASLPVQDSQDTSELELGFGAQSTYSPLLLCVSGCRCPYCLHDGLD